MDYRIIAYIIGCVLKIEGVFMVMPIITGIIYRETALWCFVITGILCFLTGVLLTRRKPQDPHFYMREGCVTVSLSWIIMSIMGALPFIFSGAIPHPIDAIFETVSGFTTTGASILSQVENLPKCILFWRSFTHWIGGMGVLVFLLSIVKMTGGSQMNLMKAESPGPSVSRLAPTVQSTAKILYKIYIGMTIAEIVILLLCKMTVLPAIPPQYRQSSQFL